MKSLSMFKWGKDIQQSERMLMKNFHESYIKYEML